MMKKLTLLALLLSATIPSFCQIYDDFSDGDFTNNPHWTGDSLLFIVNSNLELALNDNKAGTAFLGIISDFTTSEDMEWKFKIKLSFSPSANNNLKIYLASNSTDSITENSEAIFLLLGESGSNDAIEFYYQKNGQKQLLIRGENGSIANSFCYNIKLKKENNSVWKLYCDKTLNNIYTLEGETQFNADFNFLHFAILCRYTAGNSKKFYFDNFYIGKPIIDTIKPEITGILPHQNLKSLKIKYSKAVTKESALDPNNYQALDNNYYVVDCYFTNQQNNSVIIVFNKPFVEDSIFHFSISEIKDLSENIINKVDTTVLFHKNKEHDVIITEIMANPSPSIGLPVCEYIEIKNNRNLNLYFENLMISVGERKYSISDVYMKNDEYCIIIAAKDSILYKNIKKLLISSLSIKNTGQRITVYNTDSSILHTVNFVENWHQEKIKRGGGWSLEMIDINNPCEEENNWNSSISCNGGTPGERNSISALNPDITPPEIESITVIDSSLIEVAFSETMKASANTDINSIVIDRNIKVISMQWVLPENKRIQLKIEPPLKEKTIYELSLVSCFSDCYLLHTPYLNSIKFGLPEKVEAFDLILNEINPKSYKGESADYVEIYNRSNKIIDLKHIKLGTGTEKPEKNISIAPDGYILLPGNYFVWCENKKRTIADYYVPNYNCLLQPSNNLSLAANEETIFLTTTGLELIDRLHYEKSMHYPLLTSTYGVALERVSSEMPTQDNNNWRSASSVSGYGTPGYKNSQSGNIEIECEIEINPKIISPDNDGFNDYALISINLKEAEYRGSLFIYNRNGILIKTLANNQLLGTNNIFRWDGENEKGGKIPPNLYILKFEYWSISGKIKSVLKTIGVR